VSGTPIADGKCPDSPFGEREECATVPVSAGMMSLSWTSRAVGCLRTQARGALAPLTPWPLALSRREVVALVVLAPLALTIAGVEVAANWCRRAGRRVVPW